MDIYKVGNFEEKPEVLKKSQPTQAIDYQHFTRQNKVFYFNLAEIFLLLKNFGLILEMRVYEIIYNPQILRKMKIYEYTAEAKDFKIHDFMPAENKKQASEKIKKVIAKLGYQQPKTLNIYSTRY